MSSNLLSKKRPSLLLFCLVVSILGSSLQQREVQGNCTENAAVTCGDCTRVKATKDDFDGKIEVMCTECANGKKLLQKRTEVDSFTTSLDYSSSCISKGLYVAIIIISVGACIGIYVAIGFCVYCCCIKPQKSRQGTTQYNMNGGGYNTNQGAFVAQPAGGMYGGQQQAQIPMNTLNMNGAPVQAAPPAPMMAAAPSQAAPGQSEANPLPPGFV